MTDETKKAGVPESKKPDITSVDAALKSLTEEVVEIKKEQKDQRSESKTIIMGAIFAVVLLAAALVVQVSIFNTEANKDYSNLENKLEEEIQSVRTENLKSQLILQQQIFNSSYNVKTNTAR